MRRELLNRRKAIPFHEFEEASALITHKLMESAEFNDADTVHCYVSMNRRREVNTHGLIRDMFSFDKRVVVPVTNFK
ncbi:MAG TPA: 5-formyltetrahydrofolate cyclo-ligase, partial [Balneolaceae bacterium]|nr:5-formyltetrahydrofolate cyclo-ligase [Balneolaceae bacterium]